VISAPWLLFFLTGVASQANGALERTVRLVELQTALRNELLDGKATTTVVRTAERLFSTPYISATWLSQTLGVSSPTAQSAINVLVARGDSTESKGRKRNRFYLAARIFEAVYGPSPLPEQPTLLE